MVEYYTASGRLDPQTMYNEMLIQHGEPEWECAECHRLFFTEGMVDEHLVKDHGVKPEEIVRLR